MEKPGRANKVERLQSVFDVLNARRVHLPDWAAWKASFLAEVCAFPGSATDDQVDALSQFLKVMKEVARNGSRGRSSPRGRDRAPPTPTAIPQI